MGLPAIKGGQAAAHGRISLTALLCCATLGLTASALTTPTAWAGFGVAKWEAGTCKESSCNIEGKDPEAEFYTQAAGHPNFGITDFAFNYREVGITNAKEPEGKVKDVRVDLPPGLAVDPEAVQQCQEKEIEEYKCPAASKVGEDEAVGTAELALGVKTTITENFPVFAVAHKPGEPARFGVEVTSLTLEAAELLTGQPLRSVIYLEGGISWYNEAASSENSGVKSGDYHEYFKIQNISLQPEIVKSKLIFWGVPHEHNPAAPDNAFLTMPSSIDDCTQPQTTWLHVDSYENPGDFIAEPTETRLEDGTPLTATGCSALEFNPTLALTAESSQSDEPDGATADLHIPQTTSEPAKPDSPAVQTAEVALPEGMTLDPSAAYGLQACTTEEIGIGTDREVGCPAAARIGTVTVDAPGIANGALNGYIYVGSQESQEPESGSEYRVFLAAQAPSYGVQVRLEGHVKANRQTGRLTATFSDDPQVPFEDFILKFNGGPRAPLANPLSCGPASPLANLTPYSSPNATAAGLSGFLVDGNGAGAPCPAPLPFALSQSTHDQSATAGARTSFTFNLTRDDGQQYLAQVKTTLPAGLLGAIPSVTLCGAAQAESGGCPPASEIGRASATAGAGPEPFGFSGAVYLTGPYQGAPYGLSIVIPAAAGPFNLGNVVTRAAINVDPYTGRIVITSTLPTVVGGVPLRLKTVTVTIDRPNFLSNPTNCGALSTASTLTSTYGATQSLATPFQVDACDKLAFKPSFSAFSDAKTSRANGASIAVKITQGAHQANIREVQVQLPKQLPARDTTLRQACPAATFEVALPPSACPNSSRVGGATVRTPVLPGKLSGPAYLVSHGGLAFPDLDLILRGDGVEVVLIGHTHVSSAGITTSTFEALPDVPISSAVVSLPTGPQSVLAANGKLCKRTLRAPTTIVAQSGAKLTRQTKITVRNCPVKILAHRISGTRALVRVRTPAAGRVSMGGHDLRSITRHVSKARTLTLAVPLTPKGAAALRRFGHLRLALRVKFVPTAKRGASKAHTTMTFRA